MIGLQSMWKDLQIQPEDSDLLGGFLPEALARRLEFKFPAEATPKEVSPGSRESRPVQVVDSSAQYDQTRMEPYFSWGQSLSPESRCSAGHLRRSPFRPLGA